MNEVSKIAKRAPIHCFWEITEACNLRCIHCELEAGSPDPGELSTERSLLFCEELASAGCRQVILTGGEPLVRADWPILAKKIASLGMAPTMMTNGLAVDEKVVETLVDAGIRSLSVSIDGSEAVHDTIRLGPSQASVKSYERAVLALRLSASAGLKTAAVTQVHKGNLHDLPRMYDTLAALGVDTWQVQICMPLGRMMKYHREYLLEPEDISALIASLKALIPKRRMKIAVADNIGYYTKEEPLLRGAMRDEAGFWTGCKAGTYVVALSSNGNLKGCPSHPSSFAVGNIVKTPFVDLWQNEDNFTYKNHFKEELLEGKCRACAFKRLCKAGCTTMAYAVTGTIYHNPFCALSATSNGEVT